MVSQSWIPLNVAAVRPGPNVIAALFETEPAGEDAAGNGQVCRVQPEPVPTSEPEVEDGAPSESPTPQFVGRVGVAPPQTQSSMAFWASKCS